MATATRKPAKRAEEKSKVLGFVNWKVGEVTSRRGFPIMDNQYLSKEDKELIAFAEKHGGTVKVRAELTIRIAQEQKEIVFDDAVVVSD